MVTKGTALTNPHVWGVAGCALRVTAAGAYQSSDSIPVPGAGQPNSPKEWEFPSRKGRR